MLKNAPMFKAADPNQPKGRGLGVARSRGISRKDRGKRKHIMHIMQRN
jgi:hypothetical protein